MRKMCLVTFFYVSHKICGCKIYISVFVNMSQDVWMSKAHFMKNVSYKSCGLKIDKKIDAKIYINI